MFANLNQRKANDVARLKTPIVTETQCMSFYYHLFGHAGTLNIYMAVGDNLGTSLWTRTGSLGDVWRHGRLTTTKTNANIVFEGKSNVFLCLNLNQFIVCSYCWFGFDG